MTYQSAEPDEIETGPEMIEAGVSAYLEWVRRPILGPNLLQYRYFSRCVGWRDRVAQSKLIYSAMSNPDIEKYGFKSLEVVVLF